MTVSDSKDCVAYYFKRRRYCIAGPIESGDTRWPPDFLKSYVLHLVDKAKKTRTQQRIRREIVSSQTPAEMLNIVDRVIRNGDNTEFIDYAKVTR